MRTTTVGLVAVACAGAAGLAAAADTTGNNISLWGADALFGVTQLVFASCGTAFSDFTTRGEIFQGGGSGVGANQMLLDNQQIAPMSRPLLSTEYCSPTAPAAPGLTESLLIGIDGVAIVSSADTSCSTANGNANGVGVAASFAVTSDGTSTGGPPASCPGCDASNNYTFGAGGGALYAGQPSFDALAVLYFGLMHDGTYDCANPVRRSLIRNWKNLFAADCATGDGTCAAGLTHAWRLSDIDGETDALVSLLNPPGKGIGTLSTVPMTALSKKSNPFCNSLDAQSSGASVTSLGGSSDFSDLDPVRTNCTAADGVCEGFKFGATNGSFAGDLGVVQVVLPPDGTVTVLSDLYPQKPCGSSCTLVSPLKGNQIPSGFRCPGGGMPIGGACFMPFAGTTSNPDPRCISSPTTRCAGPVGRPDGRVYNMVTVVSALQVPSPQRSTTPFQFAFDAKKRFYVGSFYRIHAQAPAPGVVADPGAGTTGLCQQIDATSQLGCLVDSDPCSVGYASRAAAALFPGLGSPEVPVAAPLKALAIDGVPPFTPASVSADPNLALENLLQPAGTAPLYPLTRRLYLSTIYGFSNLQGGEQELTQCFGNNTIIATAMTKQNFVPVPSGVQCLDYPEDSTTTTTPPLNIQGTGNVAFGGCNLGLAGQNACVVSPPIISN
jgi:hypothetical protein